jgi:hypothetical protein
MGRFNRSVYCICILEDKGRSVNRFHDMYGLCSFMNTGAGRGHALHDDRGLRDFFAGDEQDRGSDASTYMMCIGDWIWWVSLWDGLTDLSPCIYTQKGVPAVHRGAHHGGDGDHRGRGRGGAGAKTTLMSNLDVFVDRSYDHVHTLIKRPESNPAAGGHARGRRGKDGAHHALHDRDGDGVRLGCVSLCLYVCG